MKTEEKELRVLEYLEGGFSPEDEKAFIADAASDAELAALLADFQQQERALESYFTARGEAARNTSHPDLRRLPVAVVPAQPTSVRRSRRLVASLAIAAGLAAAVGGVIFLSNANSGVPEHHVTVAAAVGKPQIIDKKGSLMVITPQMTITKGIDKFKTPDGSRLELALGRNGGSVELNSNSTVELRQTVNNTVVKLDRGEVMVWPAKASATLVSVTTPQLQANAQGESAFSVVRGLRGSEVAVLKGEVEIVQAGTRRRLREGESYSSTGVKPVPVVQRVAWSGKGSRVAASLPVAVDASAITTAPATPTNDAPATEIAMADSGTEPGNGTGEPKVNVKGSATATGIRTSRSANSAIGIARTTDYLPSSTFSIVEVPNLSAIDLPLDGSGDESVQSQLRNYSIRDILSSSLKGAGASEANIQQAIKKLESVVTTEELDLIKNSVGGSVSFGITPESPILIAELTDNAEAIGAIFTQKIDPWLDSQSEGDGAHLHGTVNNGLLVLGFKGKALDEAVAATSTFRPTEFRNSEFVQSLRRDVGGSRLTVAVDTATIRSLAIGDTISDSQQRFLDITGLANMKSIVAATSFSDQSQNRALRVNFDGERRGMMNWLGAPAPLGSLQFFSPDAQFVAAARIKKPDQMLNEILQWLRQEDPYFAAPDSAGDVALVKRLAATLGNEAAVGLDNPVLPIPNIKFAVEVTDPVEFHNSMLALVEAASANRAPEDQIVLDSHTYKDRLIVDLKLPRAAFNVSYAIINDYVVFGPGAAFMESTVDLSLSGTSIDHEAAFMDALPANSGSYVSMLVYTPGGRSLGDAAPFVQGFLSQRGINVDLMKLKQQGADSHPMVAYAVVDDTSIDLYINGVKGDYQMAGALPLVADFLATKTGKP
ncbi:FecR domain-containing protein [Candidatus Sumerlaeota bacterium]|nr:FecR domain-containing protein [Candidatus Sumerlaeota bacterium]